MEQTEQKRIVILISLIGGLVILLITGFVVFKLRQETISEPTTVSSSVLSPTPSYLIGELTLKPDNIKVKAGEKVVVDLAVNAKNKNIHGVDAVINYDKTFLKASRFKELSKNFIYPRKRIEDKRIIITALKNLGNEKLVGKEILVRIVFTALKAGNTSLDFEFYPGKTFGSTIIEAKNSRNILSYTSVTKITITP